VLSGFAVSAERTILLFSILPRYSLRCAVTLLIGCHGVGMSQDSPAQPNFLNDLNRAQRLNGWNDLNEAPINLELLNLEPFDMLRTGL
jgi:hypothetical protein